MRNFLNMTNPVNLLASDTEILKHYKHLKDLERLEASGQQLHFTKSEFRNLRK